MDNQERKLSSEELEALLKEVETEPEAKILPDVDKPKRKKKKSKIRIDMIIAAIVALVLVGCVIFMIVHFVGKSNTNSSREAAENALQDEPKKLSRKAKKTKKKEEVQDNKEEPKKKTRGRKSVKTTS